VSATAAAGAATGNYTVAVSRLAASQALAAAALSNSQATLGQGSLTIELGSWGAGDASFAAKAGAVPVVIAIGPGEDSLQAVRDKINAANAGITAAIVSDASGARLTLRASSSGADNAFRIGVADSDGNGADNLGLSRLAYDPSAGVSQMTRTLAAANAQASVNGLGVTSASNTLAGVLDGVTLTLSQESAVQINVAPDTAAMGKAVQGFVQAFNDLASFIANQTKYDPGSKTGGPLQGDRTALGIQSQLRSLLGAGNSASAAFGRLSDIGLELQRGGTVALKQGKLDTALGNLPELRKLFSALDPASASSAANGFGVLLRNWVDGQIGSEGAVASRSEGIRSRIKANGSNQAKLNDKVALIQQRLQERYTALDKQLGQLNGLSSYVTQQMALLNRSSAG
jgi:flagellar hook-associated protein 2